MHGEGARSAVGARDTQTAGSGTVVAPAAGDRLVASQKVLSELEPMPCGHLADEQRAKAMVLVEDLLVHVIARPAASPGDGGVVQLVDAPAVRVALYYLGSDFLLAQIGLRCMSPRRAERTRLVSLHRRPQQNEIVAREDFDDDVAIGVVATGERRAYFAMRSGLYDSPLRIERLEIRDADLKVRISVDDVVAPTYTRHGNVAVVDHRRDMRHFSCAADDAELCGPAQAPAAIAEQILVDPDRVEDRIVSRVADSPWLDALDAFCDAQPDRFPCGGDITGRHAASSGIEVEVEGRSLGVKCAAVPSPPSWLRFDADSRVVVSLRLSGQQWSVAQIRAARAGCDVYGDLLMSATPPLDSSRALFTSGVARAIEQLPDGLLVATADAIVRISEVTAPATLVEVDADVRDVAHVGDRIALIEAFGRILVGRGGHFVELTTDDDAIGITGCGSDLCWSAYRAGEVRRWRRGKVDVVATGLRGPRGLAWDGDRLVVATTDGVFGVAPGGTPQRVAGATAAVIDVAVDEARVAWLDEAGSISLKMGDQVPTKRLAPGGRPASIALMPAGVAWVDAVDGAVRVAPLP